MAENTPKQPAQEKLAEGSPVRLADREPAAADTKSGLFYPHYRALTGTVAKLYADGTATVSIDPESLPAEIRARHQAGTDAMRQKWLDNLSDEARNKLSAAEDVSLRYNLLVGVADLSPAEALALKSIEAPVSDAPVPATVSPRRGQAIAKDVGDGEDVPETPRKSMDELQAEEDRYIADRAAKKDE